MNNVAAFTNNWKDAGKTAAYDDLNDVDAAINASIQKHVSGLSDEYEVTFTHSEHDYLSECDSPTVYGDENNTTDATRKLVNGILSISKDGMTKEYTMNADDYNTTVRYYTPKILNEIMGDYQDLTLEVSWDEYSQYDDTTAVKTALQAAIEEKIAEVVGNENLEEVLSLVEISVERYNNTSGDVQTAKPVNYNPYTYKADVTYTNKLAVEDNGGDDALSVTSNKFNATVTVADTPAEKQLDGFSGQTVVVDTLVKGTQVTESVNEHLITAIPEAVENYLKNQGWNLNNVSTHLVEDAVNHNYGSVSEDGVWTGSIYLSLNNGAETNLVTKEISVPLTLSNKDVVESIELTDTRSDEEKLMARKDADKGIEQVIESLGNKVTFKLNMGDGSTETVKLVYNNNTPRFEILDAKGKGTGAYEDAVVLDYSEFEKKEVGSIQFYVRSVADTNINTGFEGKIYYDTTLDNAADLDLAVDAAKAETGDSAIATARVENGKVIVRVLNAGTTSLTVTDKDRNVVTVDITVRANGSLKVDTKFAAESVVKTFDELKLAGVLSDSKIESEDEDYITAEYVVNEDGEDCIRFTPKAIANKQDVTVYVYGGDNGRIVNEINVSISETGAMTIKQVSNLNNKRFSISNDVREAIQEQVYYRDMLLTTDADTNVWMTANTAARLAYTNDYIGLDNIADLKITVTADVNGKSVKDTLPLSAFDFACANGNVGVEAAAWEITLDEFKYLSGNTAQTTDPWACTIDGITMKARILADKNDTATLGILAEEASSDKGRVTIEELNSKEVNLQDADGENKELEISDYYAITPEKQGSDTVTFSDENGQSAILNLGIDASAIYNKAELQAFSLDDVQYSDMTFQAPTKTEYYIGEDLDFSGASFSFKHTQTSTDITVNIKPEMFKTTSGKVLTTDEAADYEVVFEYGGIQFPTNGAMTFRILPRTAEYTLSDLNIPEGETIAQASITDGNISNLDADIHSDQDMKVTVTANKVDVKGTLTVVTDKGTVKRYNLTVSEDGQISMEDVSVFKSTKETFSPESLGLAPSTVNTAVSSDVEVATAVISDNNIVVTSVSQGEATITVTDTDGNVATIDITVNRDGSMDYVIHPYSSDGWVNLGNGDWGYIKDGERVVSKWLSVIEEDPYNDNEVGKVWYHFDAEGKMQRGWISDPEVGWKIYLLDSNGRMMHSDWVNAPEQKHLNRPAGIYHLNDDGSVQMNGWALAKNSDSIYWLCNAGNGLFEKDNPASWASEKLW